MPAAGTHAAISTSYSGYDLTAKSHVLAGVQDAYWSDDEAEDSECPLCLEEMDLSDINFKPCPCGYQICRFCWHHIRQNLNGRCPACRRTYTEEQVVFTPISSEDQKRLNQQKRIRERQKKELENLKRSHFANVRIVQRNLVYVTGLGPRFAKEELLPTLRSTEYFGKYGKINRIVLVKRTVSSSDTLIMGLYITYNRREDAARAISAVDGTPSPGGDGEVLRASYGTTKYCMSFLRSVPCMNQGCLDLHEWGDERDCFTKEDLTTLKHTMKDTENRPNMPSTSRRDGDPDGQSVDPSFPPLNGAEDGYGSGPALPRSAQWGQKSGTPQSTHAAPNPLPTTGRLVKSARTRNGPPYPSRNMEPLRSSHSRSYGLDKKTTYFSDSASRPSTPGIASLPPKPAGASESLEGISDGPASTSPVPMSKKPIKDRSTPSHSRKQKSLERVSTAAEIKAVPPQTAASEQEPNSHSNASDTVTSPKPIDDRGAQDIRSESVPPLSPSSTAADSTPSNFTPPPPGLTLPPVQSSYQLSNQAKALMDDVINRRQLGANEAFESPFPDFDRTLSNLGDGSFSFNLSLDPKMATKLQDTPSDPNFGPGIVGPFGLGARTLSEYGSAPAGSPPYQLTSSSSSHTNPFNPSPSDLDSHLKTSSYAGSFDPFSEASSNSSPVARSQPSPFDDDPLRRGSKFGFARKDQNSQSNGFSSSTSSPLRYTDALPAIPLYNSTNGVSPKPNHQQSQPWMYQQRQLEFNQSQQQALPPPPGMLHPYLSQSKPSPHMAYQTYNQAPQQLPHQQFSPFDGPVNRDGMGLDGALNLKDLLNLGNRPVEVQRQRAGAQQGFPAQNIVDTAIMSMRLGPSYRESQFPITNGMQRPQMAFQGPPGLNPSVPPPNLNPHDGISFDYRSSNVSRATASPNAAHEQISVAPSEPTTFFSESDFPALPPPSEPQLRRQHAPLAIPATTTPKELPSVLTSPPSSKRTSAPASPSDGASIRKLHEGAKLKVTESEDKFPPTEASEAAAAPPSSTVPSCLMPKDLPQPLLTTPSSRKANRKPDDVSLLISLSSVTKKEQTKSKEKVTANNEKTEVGSDLTPDLTSGTSPVKDAPQEQVSPNTVDELAEDDHDLSQIFEGVDLSLLSFFDESSISPFVKIPLNYGPLVYALSTLSEGGEFGSQVLAVSTIDSAVVSFKQLLETLTQNISDLVRLFPRTSSGDSTPFDGVLRDMLKSEEFFDEVPPLDISPDSARNGGQTEEMHALTLSLEKRARWMEIQLEKLEGLHRDINNAATHSTMNDRGWDRRGLLPRRRGLFPRLEDVGMVELKGVMRNLTLEELERELVLANGASATLETELRQAMKKSQVVLPTLV
ncbi:uncharacterized protein EI90DRAFT_3121331 [Cantharellus anzutake]|uniref:uncharacterized protein n=1 Tax=Cantharellus anzutake TaxID=1750568 RepID=UPI001904C27B|nr:uncharacterized protein EI90DRAFT_3121331 [Cantharellus anzutake]KAF8333953.1 hypothetical protein EI90DRAFT_3121331 [Cantharellus anzutake]